MKRTIIIIGSILFATAIISPAWAKKGGGESQKGGLPALEDRVEADEALITSLQGQNNFAVVTETPTSCTLVSSGSGAGTPTATFVSAGVCEVTFGKNVSACASQATIVGATGGEITVTGATNIITGDSVDVTTFIPAGIVAAASDFNLTVTCP